jgi:hypothetical protein
MQDQGNYRKDQQQVDQTTCNVKYSETANPSYQQNHKQNGPDAHYFSPLPARYAERQRRNSQTATQSSVIVRGGGVST